MTLVGMMTDLKAALHAGDFDAMAELAAQIDAALPEVTTLAKADLAALGRLATENARGLDAARQGVRAARRRLAEIAAADRGVTYDRNGALSGRSTGMADLRF